MNKLATLAFIIEVSCGQMVWLALAYKERPGPALDQTNPL